MRRTMVPLLIALLAIPSYSRAQDTTQVIPAGIPMPVSVSSGNALVSSPSFADTAPQAVEHSDMYYTRLTIHRYASYTEIPLFAAEYYLGNKLMSGPTSSSVKGAHQAVALGLAGLFTVNTVTGVWNLVESRHDKEGRGRRILHSALMLASDAGFAYTGAIASNASHGGQEEKNKHRTAGLVSIGFATAGTLMMWLR